MTRSLHRRDFLRRVALASGAVAVGGSTLRTAMAGAVVVAGPGPYGPLAPTPDRNGLHLPAGFTSRLLATSGTAVGASGYVWHANPDGGICEPVPGGGWVYVSNSEVGGGAGGAGVLRFDAGGNVVDAYRILGGTSRNCAGGRTASGTWLSCEENGAGGRVHECDPLRPGQGVPRPALGSFNHEAAFEDPVSRVVYLTEDDPSGRLYRFVPTVAGDLSVGQLFAASVSDGLISWVPTSAAQPDRQATTTVFNGGEGLWIEGRRMYVTTKGDKRVWEIELDTQRISVLYDGVATPGAALNAVDNCTVHHPSGDLYVCEDGGNMEVGVIAPRGDGTTEVAAFLRIVGHDASEWCGVAFSPDHRRMYLSSQRGNDGRGRTYEITGPFRTSVVPPPPSETLVAAGSTWRFHDLGADLGTGWRALGYDDSSWSTGAAPLGYGDPMATTVGFGLDAARKHITTYFRRSFTATHGFSALVLNLRRDDGAVVYVNGTEVARSNMPVGTVTAATLAARAVAGADEITAFAIPVTAALYNGVNVVAVELHQSDLGSSDLGFDCSLVGTGDTGPLPPPPAPPAEPETLVAAGSRWRFHDRGADLGPAWRDYHYDDAGWPEGAAPLGYGDPVTTTLGFGADPARKHVTTYFRQSFTATHGYTSLTLRLRRDDGAVVHLNGREIARTNLPTGAVTAATLASTAITGADETTFVTIPVTGSLVAGRNVLAVEVHQSARDSSDLLFDAALTGLGDTGPLPPPPAPPTTSIAVAEDAHVRGGSSAAKNFGGATTAQVQTSTPDATRWLYLELDTSPHTATISRAILRLRVTGTSGATVPLALHAVDPAAWAESTITWNTRPTPGVQIAGGTVTGSTATWLQLDVTSYVKAERAAGRSRVSFVLRAPSAGQLVSVVSSESTSTSSRPHLVVSG
jgi:hypothetical protein